MYYFRNSSPACLRKKNPDNYTYHTYRSQVGEIITIYVHTAIQSFTVKEEVDLQNRGLFVSTTSEAPFRFLISRFFRKKKKEKGERVKDFPYRCRSQRISASRTRLSFDGLTQTIFVTIFSFCFFFLPWHVREYSPRVRLPHQRSSSDLPHLKQQSSGKKNTRDKKKT